MTIQLMNIIVPAGEAISGGDTFGVDTVDGDVGNSPTSDPKELPKGLN
jgi:hypothetical protein